MQITHTTVMNLENALRGMRNPMNSHDKSDSCFQENGDYVVGTGDLKLAARLCGAGTDHRKFLRQIFVSVDIRAPIYWWKEYDTYKIGTTANSTSTMHKLHSKPITLNDFETESMADASMTRFALIIEHLESLRQEFVDTGSKAVWYDLIRMLPCAYLQTRTCTLNYEVLRNMVASRRGHKLREWHTFCDWAMTLPYADILISNGKEETHGD